ncbi:MAG: hypothetical protein AAF581_06885 [Planctomycetota bacterium]
MLHPASEASASKRGTRLRAATLLVFASLLFGISMLAVVRVPLGFLWLPTLAVSVWGHFLGLLAVAGAVVLVARRRTRRALSGRLAAALCTTAGCLSFVPAAQLVPGALDLEERITAAFGSEASALNAAVRQAPVVVTEVFGVESPPVLQESVVYHESGAASLRLELLPRA